MDFPDFTDLRQIALELEGNPSFEALRQSIESAWRAQSCVADVRQAKDACDTLTSLRQSPRQQGSLARATTENALLVTAVLLYARATSTSGRGGERGSIQLDDRKLTEEQLADHNILIEVRNRALAHVYRESPIGEKVWHEDVFFAVDLEDRGWKPAVGSSRVSFHLPTFDRLLRQIPVADALVLRAFHKRMNAVTRLMNDASVPVELFKRFRFDPAQKFGGVKAAKDILAGIPTGSATVLIG